MDRARMALFWDSWIISFFEGIEEVSFSKGALISPILGLFTPILYSPSPFYSPYTTALGVFLTPAFSPNGLVD
jgi:hypothetical protein